MIGTTEQQTAVPCGALRLRWRRLGAALALLPLGACGDGASRGGRPDTMAADRPDPGSPRITASPAVGCDDGSVVRPAGADSAAGVSALRVSTGSPGMFSTPRWTRAPDGCALLIVQAAASVEADPVPDGFLLASERGGFVHQRDSVWDVAPSPGWDRIAFATAHGAQPGGRAETLSGAEWASLGARAGISGEAARAGSFSCSGMNYVYCLARLNVVPAAGPPSSGSAPSRPVLAGWRVRWSGDGRTVYAGIPPGRQDFAPPSAWLAVDPTRLAVRDTLPAADSARFADPGWSEGPLLTYGVTIDLAARSELAVDGGTVVSADGTITAPSRSPSAGAARDTVGPGRALAATRGGRFIAAIVPASRTPEREWGYEILVYDRGPAHR